MIKLNPLFTDGAVFQRRVTIPVWGTTDGPAIIRCEMDGIESMTAAGLDGCFFLRLPAHEAGGPYTLTVTNMTSGEKQTVSDILVGEVWLASGQSNMEFKLLQSYAQADEFPPANRDTNTVRMFTVEKRNKTTRENEVTGSWKKSTKDNVFEFSAVGVWFAQKLRDELNVPVGIIHSSWGGTIAEAWTSRNTLMRNPDYAAAVANYTKQLNTPRIWEKVKPEMNLGNHDVLRFIQENCTPDKENTGFKLGWAAPDFDDSEWFPEFRLPAYWTKEIWITKDSTDKSDYKALAGNGIVWVRREIDIPQSMAGKDLVMNLGNIDKQDITYFNGEEIGRTGKNFDQQFWSVPRTYQVPGRLVHAGRNVIAIRAYSFAFDGNFGGAEAMYNLEVAGTDQKIVFGGQCKFCVEKDFGKIMMTGGGSALPGPDNANSPSNLFDEMIRPLIPYAMRGVIWYQGESNAHSVETSRKYERLMKDLITDWRFWWEQGDFPFIQVHLAGYTGAKHYEKNSTWGYLRESQRKAAAGLKNAGLASALDCGDLCDIHPKDKRTVGYRLAAWALKNTYGLPVCGEGPSMKECFYEGSKVRILFDNCDGGLVTNDGKAPDDFFVAGPDNVYYPADAVIEGNTVLLSSKDISNPQHVRFAWAAYPEHLNLYNGKGFPAQPFEG